MKEDEVMRDAVKVVCDELIEQARRVAEANDRTVVSCLMTLLRPWVVNYLAPETASPMAKDIDNRTRPWQVKIIFWRQATDAAIDKIGENEPEKVSGLVGVTDLIRLYFNEIHSDNNVTWLSVQGFDDVRMSKRMAGIRGVMAKGGGSATLRIRYTLDDGFYYTCQADIMRL